jgi:cytochrome c biogenesis protein CcmG/thiol:disulfide interchange protein DsbE
MNFVLRFLVLAVPIAFISMFYVLLSTEDSYPGADYKVFEIPQFSLPSLDDSSNINNDSLKGDFIINVWASWCITCRVEHPYLSKLSREGIKIIGLNYKDEREDAVDWINKFGDPYDLIIHDIKGALALDMGVTGAPETFLVQNGIVVAHYQGEVNQLTWNKVFEPIIDSKKINLK